jgi:perosamine synthetase
MSSKKIRLKVFAIPPLSPWDIIFGSNEGELPGPYGSGRIRFYHNGRNAIWHAIKALSFSPGENVLFPAFQCGSELDPFVKAGIPVCFYPIDRSFNLDLDALKSLINEKTKAVYVIHFFGFPQKIDEIELFCKERRLVLIEDCAHLLTGRYKGRALGTFGDLSIFSMRKFLPTPDGGALRVNNPEIPLPEIPPPPPIRVTLKKIRKKISKYFDSRMGPGGRFFRRYILRPPLSLMEKIGGSAEGDGSEEAAYLMVEDQADWGMARFSMRLMSRLNLESIARRRRENTLHYIRRIEPTGSLAPMFTKVPDEVSPFVFPLLVREAGSFVRHMNYLGIGIRFWSEFFHPQFPTEAFPEATYLKNHVVMLPVHQDLDAATVKWIADTVTEWQNNQSEP